MAYIEWTDEMSVNVAEIDRQHQRLIAMINTLHAAFLEQRGREAQKQIIGEMVDYAAYHFAVEEKHMVRLGYPDYDQHKQEHDRFTAKAFDLKARTEENAFVVTLELLRFLRDWLRHHILGTDKAYSGFFNEHGLY
jgi:hemerythrin